MLITINSVLLSLHNCVITELDVKATKAASHSTLRGRHLID